MLTAKDDRANSQRKLVVKLWGILEGETRGGIPFEALRSVVYAVMRSSQAQTAPEARLKCNPDPNRTRTGYGKYVDDTFVIGFAEADSLHRMFKALYLNKMGQQRQAAKAEKYPHRPQLGNVTLRMTNNLTEKRKEMVLRKQSHNDISLTHHKTPSLADMLLADREEQERQFQTYKLRLEAERGRECTFRPDLNSKQS